MTNETVEIRLTFEQARLMIEAAKLAKSRLPEECSEALSWVSFKLGRVFGRVGVRATTVNFSFEEARAVVRAAALAGERLPEEYSAPLQEIGLALEEASEYPLTSP